MAKEMFTEQAVAGVAAKLVDKLPYLGLGTYPEVEVEEVHQGASHKTGKAFYKIQVKILKAEPGATNPVGSSAVQVITAGAYDYFIRDTIKFVAAAMNERATRVTKAMIDACASEEQPATGIRLRLNVVKGKNPDFPNIQWSSLETTN